MGRSAGGRGDAAPPLMGTPPPGAEDGCCCDGLRSSCWCGGLPGDLCCCPGVPPPRSAWRWSRNALALLGVGVLERASWAGVFFSSARSCCCGGGLWWRGVGASTCSRAASETPISTARSAKWEGGGGTSGTLSSQ